MLTVDNLVIRFPKPHSKLIFKKEYQTILHNITFSVKQGECLGILGESGSGKSTIGKVICGLLTPYKGTVTLSDTVLYGKEKIEPGILSVVFQDYTTSVNSRFTVRDIIKESLVVLQRRTQVKLDFDKETIELLELVGLSADFINRYPHQLSGGQLQRVCIARAIAVKPELILFDEAISSLDAHTQVQIMDLLMKVKAIYNFTYIFITHDLPSVTYMCDRVLFLNKGQVAEIIPVEMISEVRSEYARKLLHSILEINRE
ncbi:ABC transporter ATP-binding protein [Veillonella criceti]|uniref:Glutathione import ATP-binding protein GsiA n=1 Tax=Veillonella criceti TaxID=103891 RepID=A0A380NK77_9FIRM|nr:ABC transporter ATP-binding protein [Veillonella criceti]SUP41501.1 Glutathione import ATP-binding protein GsiA [Veillonella criceti]